MLQEGTTQRGRGSSRADIVVAKSTEAARDNRDWAIVVEAKAENVPIDVADYSQGESYARAVGAEFLVMHNIKETIFFRLVPGAPGRRVEIAELPGPDDLGDDARLRKIRSTTKLFTREEFQRLLHECHSILRDNHKMEPGAAFDEISKILFIKMAFERQGNSQVFTTDRLRAIARANLLEVEDPQVVQQVFAIAKQYYRAEELFPETDRLSISLPTFERILAKLERFNLSDTGDDIKGIAFEKFLSSTFRGSLGQFFTPRPIVNFMIEMINPREGEIICDPACGTGGFLIGAFDRIRDDVKSDVREQKSQQISNLQSLALSEGWSEEQLESAIQETQHRLNLDLDVGTSGSRLNRATAGNLFGCDAEPRAARTSKMNMIMHGDGHTGIYYRDGLLDTAGIYEDRFDIVLTNPPFGSNVGRDQIVGATDQTRIETDADQIESQQALFGEGFVVANHRLKMAAQNRTPILALFDIGRDPIAGPIETASVRASRMTEALFLERCIRLLKPGGRLAIILPDGLLNNPSSSWLRRYVEQRARLLAIISIPQEVFAASKATVKTSIVMLQRFSEQDCSNWAAALNEGAEDAAQMFAGRWKVVREREASADVFGRPELAPLVETVKSLERSDAVANARAIRQARAKLRAAITPEDRARQRSLRAEINALKRKLEKEQQEAALNRAREIFSYPVFLAESSRAGITATGETGNDIENDLPDIAAEYRKFVMAPSEYMQVPSTLPAAGVPPRGNA